MPKIFRKGPTDLRKWMPESIQKELNLDNLTILMLVAAFLVLLTVVAAMLLSPRSRRKRMQARLKEEHLSRPWLLLELFPGCLYSSPCQRRSPPTKETKLSSLHRLALSSDVNTQTNAVACLSYVTDLMPQRMPAVIPTDLQLVFLWANAPAPAVTQRILLMVAVLGLSRTNRDRLSKMKSNLKAIIAAGRAASKLRQLTSTLAMYSVSRSRDCCDYLVKAGALDVLSAIIDHKTGVRDEKLLLGAALALVQIVSFPENRKRFTKLAFLRNVIALSRIPDTRLQLCSVTILSNLASSAEYRTAILDAGTLVAMIPLSISPNVAVQAQACRTIRYLVAGHSNWLRRLRAMCSTADEVHSDLVWTVRRQQALAAMPQMLDSMEALVEKGLLDGKEVRKALDLVGVVFDRGAQYHDASDAIETEDEVVDEEADDVEFPDSEEDLFSSAPSSPASQGHSMADWEDETGHRQNPARNSGTTSPTNLSEASTQSLDSDKVNPASSSAIMRKKSHSPGKSPGKSPKLSGDYSDDRYFGDDAESEEEEHQKKSVDKVRETQDSGQSWGKEYSSFTHKVILKGLTCLEEKEEMMDDLIEEIKSLVDIDAMMLMLDQCTSELPTLLQELRRHYRAGEERKEELKLSEDELVAMQERATSVSRPLESAISILNKLKNEALGMAREVTQGHKDRQRDGLPPWAYYYEHPLAGSSGPTNLETDLTDPKAARQDVHHAHPQTDDLVSGGFEADDSLAVNCALKQFLAEYHENYVTERAVVSQSQLLPRQGKRPEVMINKQFARDVPSLLQLNGIPCPGESDEDKIRYAYEAIVKAVDGNTEKAQRITLVANQNLGVYMYEQIVKAYANQPDIAIMQEGEHHLDIKTTRRGIVVVFVALFRLQPMDSIEVGSGDLVRGIARVDFVKKTFSLSFTKPRSR